MFSILGNLFLLSVAFAIPSSQLGDPLAHDHEMRQSQSVKRATIAQPPITYTDHWGGAYWSHGQKSFNYIIGTVVAPAVSGRDGGARAWIGIDGYQTCNSNGALRAGINFTIVHGVVKYGAWYQWYPDQPHAFTPAIDIKSSDVIKLTLIAPTDAYGVVAVENVNTGQLSWQVVSSHYALCEQDALWIVDDTGMNNQPGNLANFSTITFTGAAASGPGGVKFTSGNATGLFDIYQLWNDVSATASVDKDTLTIEYKSLHNQ